MKNVSAEVEGEWKCEMTEYYDGSNKWKSYAVQHGYGQVARSFNVNIKTKTTTTFSPTITTTTTASKVNGATSSSAAYPFRIDTDIVVIMLICLRIV